MRTSDEQEEYFTRLLAQSLLHEDKTQFSKALAELGDVSDVVFLNLPMSSNGFSFKGVGIPGRNDACLCGSGKKFKKCCMPKIALPLPDPHTVFSVALSGLTDSELASLVSKPNWTFEAVAEYQIVASQRGLYPSVVEITLPLLGGRELPAISRLRNEHQEVISYLLDALFEVGDQSLRIELMHRLTEHKPAPSLQSLAYQRLAMIESQQGEHKQAEINLQKALRCDPNQIELPMTELSILGLHGSDSEVRARAQFWKAKLLKRYNEEYPIIQFLNDVLENGKQVFQQYSEAQQEHSEYEVKELNVDPDDVESFNAAVLMDVMASKHAGPCYDLKIKQNEATLSLNKHIKKAFKAWHAAYQHHGERVESYAGQSLNEDQLGEARWELPNNEWLEVVGQWPELLFCFEWLQLVSPFIYQAPVPLEDEEKEDVNQCSDFSKVQAIFDFCQTRAVNEVIKTLPDHATLPSRLKANHSFWDISRDMYFSMRDRGRSIEQLLESLETFLSLDSEPQGWVVTELAWLYLQTNQHISMLDMMENIRRMPVEGYLLKGYAYKLNQQNDKALACIQLIQKRNKKLLIALKQALTEECSDPLDLYPGIWSFYYQVAEPEVSEFHSWLLRNLPGA